MFVELFCESLCFYSECAESTLKKEVAITLRSIDGVVGMFDGLCACGINMCGANVVKLNSGLMGPFGVFMIDELFAPMVELRPLVGEC